MPGRVVIFGWSESVHVRRWVAGLSEQGWQIRLISLGGDAVPGVETIILPRRGRLSYIKYRSRALELAHEFKPDLVHVHYAGGFGWWGLKCDFAPLLVSVWGSDLVGLDRNLVRKFLVRRLLRGAESISVTSRYLRESCTNLVDGIQDKITIIPFGVTLPDSVSPLPSPPVKLCFIKMHRVLYGPDILLRALAIARTSIPDIRLTLAGDGEMTPGLKRLCGELGLESNVDFVGFIPNERIYSLLSDHHIMVMPSLAESFGVAVLEAAACGRPAIASRVGGVPEVMRDGETGILIPPGDPAALADAIVCLAGDFALIETMGQAAYNLVRREFSWQRSLEQMGDLYESVASRPMNNLR